MALQEYVNFKKYSTVVLWKVVADAILNLDSIPVGNGKPLFGAVTSFILLV